MIKATELRIGNLLQIHFEVNDDLAPIIVRGVNEKFISWSEPGGAAGPLVLLNEGYQPVPLSEEWLQRMGFKVKNESFNSPHGKRHEVLFYLSPFFGDFKQNRLQFRFYDDGKPLCWLLAEVGPTPSGATALSRIAYVHQLQNLYFALTGAELTIKP